MRLWIYEGALRTIDIGKGWRIANTDLEQFLTHHKTTPCVGGFAPVESNRPYANSNPAATNVRSARSTPIAHG